MASLDEMTTPELRAALAEAIPTIRDLMASHEELLEGVGNIVVDYELLNRCRIQGDQFIRRYT